jgi:hypothetical protein
VNCAKRLDPVCILEKRASRHSSFLAVAQSNAQNDIKLALKRWENYKQRKNLQAEKTRSEHGFDARF